MSDNEFLHHLDTDMCDSGDQFNGGWAKQILIVKDMIFKEMRETTKVNQNDSLRAESLNVKSITKPTLCYWLELMCCLFESYTTPMLYGAINLEDDHRKLMKQKIVDQESIIALQEKLIEKKDSELGDVNQVVKSELKSYSSIVQKSCKEALAPRKMTTAIRKAAVEEDRSKNLIVYGMREEKNENLEIKVQAVLENLDEKPRIVKCSRVGKEEPEKVRPVLFSLQTSDLTWQILKKSRMLKEVDGYSDVYICRDRSLEDRKAYKLQVDELKKRRLKDPSKRYYIKDNEIRCAEMD